MPIIRKTTFLWSKTFSSIGEAKTAYYFKISKNMITEAIQLHLVTEGCTICSSHSRQPVRKLLDMPVCVCAHARARVAYMNTKSSNVTKITLQRGDSER